MTYIVRVKGYNSFWTGDKTPGKLWSDKITNAKTFSNELDAINVVYTGINMEVVEYDTAVITPQTITPDNSLLEEAAKKIRDQTSAQGFKTIDDDEYEELLQKNNVIVESTLTDPEKLEDEDFIENLYFQEGVQVDETLEE